MKKSKQIIVLFVVLLSLGILAYWDEIQTEKDKQAESQDRLAFPFSLDQVIGFQFHRIDKKTSANLVFDGGQWQVKDRDGLLSSADVDTIETILKNLATYKYERNFPISREQLSEFGLDEPRRWMKIFLQDGSRLDIAIGFDTKVGYSLYFMVNSSLEIYSGPQYLLTATDREYIDFRDKSVANIDQDQILDVSYRAGGDLLFEISQETGEFSFKFPKGIKPDSEAIAQFFKNLSRVEVTNFLDRPDEDFLKKFESSQEKIQIAVTLKDGRNEVLSYAGVDGGYWIELKDDRFGLLSDSDVSKLTQKLIFFRDRKIFDLRSSDVGAIEVDGKLYNKIDGDFISKETGEKNGKMYNFMMDLIFVKANNIFLRSDPTVKEFLAHKSSKEVVLYDRDNKVHSTIRVYPSSKEPFFNVTLSTKPNEVYEVEKKIFNQ